MPDLLPIDPKTSALLVMDYQRTVVEGPAVPGSAADKEALLARTASLIEGARKVGMKIIYVVVGFRAGYPEVSPHNRFFSTLRESGRFLEGAVGTEIHPTVGPRSGDIIVMKHRVNAFFGTDLDIILRANGVETLVLAGIASSGVVLSTIRHAFDADYGLVVVEDCCADPDPEVHRVLMQKVFARPALVTTAEAFVQALPDA